MLISGVIALGLTLSGCSDASGDARPEHRDFAFTGKALTIDTDDGNLQVRPADVRGVEVTRWFKGQVVIGGKPRTSWALDGDTLRFRTHCVGFVSRCSIRHEVLVPRGVEVTVRSGNGGVTASGFATALAVDASNGAVNVTDSTGDLALSTHNGEVVTDRIRARRVKAGSSNGAVRLGFSQVPDRVDAASHNGEVTVELPRAVYAVTAHTDNGRTRVDVPDDPRSGHVVTARSSNGPVSVRPAT